MANNNGFVSGFGGDYELKMPLTKSSVAINDLVIIEITEQDPNKQRYGNLFLPDSAVTNVELVTGKIISIGPEIKDNININDTVLYDRYSAFGCPPVFPGTIIVTKYENVVCLRNNDIQPLGNTVLLEVDKSVKTELMYEGIIIPDKTEPVTKQYVVVELGSGGRDENGNLIPFTVNKGDKVIVNETGSTTLNTNELKYKIVKQENILAIME